MSIEAEERQIRLILGIAEDGDIPRVSNETIETYYRYLKKNLSFPFEAQYEFEIGPLETKIYSMIATKLLELDKCDVKFYGLFCEGRKDRRKIVVPLAEVTAKDKHGKNYQLIEHYRGWFWNYR